MSRTGRLYGDSLYDLAAGEGLKRAIRNRWSRFGNCFGRIPLM